MASPFIFNAALAGAMGGPERWIESGVAGDYALQSAAAAAFAAAVDAVVPAPVGNEVASARLLESICQGFWAERFPLSVFSADYSAAAAAIAAEYAEALLQLEAEASGGGGGVAISAGTTLATSGTVIFSNSPTVSFGLNGQTLTASAVAAAGARIAAVT